MIRERISRIPDILTENALHENRYGESLLSDEVAIRHDADADIVLRQDIFDSGWHDVTILVNSPGRDGCPPELVDAYTVVSTRNPRRASRMFGITKTVNEMHAAESALKPLLGHSPPCGDMPL